ncbi:MAG: hypothetical protein IKA32_02640 [Lentisphaeria bacterium]|nr:hypothetical protein [Lentisphaeria bacterium]
MKNKKTIAFWVILSSVLSCGILEAKPQLQLQLPPAIYAVPGVEMNVYFDNIVMTPNPANYVFDVNCSKGRNEQKRWRFMPKESDVGTHTWGIDIISEEGIVASGKTKLIVSPANAGQGRNLSILIIGDSLTQALVYPSRIKSLLDKPGNPKVKLVGTVGWREVWHEGYGGWRWDIFMEKLTPSKVKPGTPPQVYHRASPFAFNGKIDIPAYFKKHNNGKAPDFITIQLGTNDVFTAQDYNLDERIKQIFRNADRFIRALRKAAPDAVIGVGLVPPAASSQDAFGFSCQYTRWQYKKNQHKLNAEMIRKFADYPDKKVFIVPGNINLDCENYFPTVTEPISAHEKHTRIVRQNNAVHPANCGYRQMGDSFYSWIKYQLSLQDKKK